MAIQETEFLGVVSHIIGSSFHTKFVPHLLALGVFELLQEIRQLWMGGDIKYGKNWLKPVYLQNVVIFSIINY